MSANMAVKYWCSWDSTWR